MIIELSLPGKERTTVVDVGDLYKITIMREDGIACTEVEARTVMASYAIQRASGKRLNTKPRKTKTKAALQAAAVTAFFAP